MASEEELLMAWGKGCIHDREGRNSICIEVDYDQ